VTTRIAILVEGKTEAAFKPVLLNYLQRRLAGNMPKLDFVPQDGRIPKEAKLKRQVELLLRENDWVIALTDVYAGSIPRDFEDANDAKAKMQNVGRHGTPLSSPCRPIRIRGMVAGLLATHPATVRVR
jgi:hypothetical protein